MDPETLVLGAYEDGAYYVAETVAILAERRFENRLALCVHEDCEQTVVSSWVVLRIEDREKDQPSCSDDREYYRADTQKRFFLVIVGSQSSSMSKPSLGDERYVEDDNHCRASGDEQRLEERCTDV